MVLSIRFWNAIKITWLSVMEFYDEFVKTLSIKNKLSNTPIKT